jgi:hypothetical protein
MHPPAAAKDKLLYVAAWSGAVQTVRLDGEADEAAVVHETRDDCGASPSWLTLDARRGVLYCVDEGLDRPAGSLWVLRPDREGRLHRLRTAPTLAGPTHGVLHDGGGNYTLSH